MTLYVDVQGTLLDSWENPNPDVLAFVERYEGDVVVWSGAGRQAAERAAELAGILRDFIALDKSLTNVTLVAGDTIVDDDEFVLQSLKGLGDDVGFSVMHPRDIPEEDVSVTE